MTQKVIMGKKVGMTQIFAEDGKIIPVTVVEAAPSVIVQIKDKATDGYQAIQLGFDELRAKQTNKPQQGHFAKADVKPTSTAWARNSPWNSLKSVKKLT